MLDVIKRQMNLHGFKFEIFKKLLGSALPNPSPREPHQAPPQENLTKLLPRRTSPSSSPEPHQAPPQENLTKPLPRAFSGIILF